MIPAIPTGLTNGVNCLAIAPEVDNAIYNGTLTGTIASLRSAINNSANWLTNNSTQQTFTTIKEFSSSAILFWSNPQLSKKHRDVNLLQFRVTV